MRNIDRFRACLAGESVDRLPRVEWAPWWNQTIKVWQSQGLPVEEYDVFQIQKYWNLDPLVQCHFRSITAGPKPAFHGGGLCSSEEEYKELLPYLYKLEDQPWQHLRRYSQLQKDGECSIWLTAEGFFWFPRKLFGIEGHLYAFYDHPELMHRINRDQALCIKNLLLKIKNEFSDFSPAFMTLAEDMSYNHGPMLSKELFDEFIVPYYRDIIPAIKETLNCPVIIDSDGLIDEMIPWLLDCGVDGVLPLERQSGVDANKLKKQHPELIIIGNYDKLVMNKGEDEIRAEFERLTPAIKAGKFIPSVDHQTPPAVSIDDYKIYKRYLDEYTQIV